ncbi:uncharacterized protein cracdla [Genypterus blacodes]|uniref:uncharacterized protein cracdla n=1 Tax=Genypterus blacodes TaxID=154954 RepID=UPI003F77464C
MESFVGEADGSTEDIPGKKQSKLKTLKSRLFGKNKRAGGEDNAKLSQSSSDITAGQGLGSDEDLASSQRMMGSRAFSHDSIFLTEQDEAAAEPDRVLSDENVHSNIKTLQMKLQQQKLHFGPPLGFAPVRRPEEHGGRSEEDSPTAPGHASALRPLSKAISQSKSTPTTLLSSTPSSSFITYIPPPPAVSEPPLHPSGFTSYIPPPPAVSEPLLHKSGFTSYIPPPPAVSEPLLHKSGFTSYIPPPPAVSEPLLHKSGFTSYISPPPAVSEPPRPTSGFISYLSPAVERPLDLGSPPQFNPCLDTSAARHRMSVKPRNQRASTKGKRHPTTDSYLGTLNYIDFPVSEKEEEQSLPAQEEMLHSHSTQIWETGQEETNGAVTSKRLPLKSQEREAITSKPSEAQAAPRSSNPTFSLQYQSLPGGISSLHAQVIKIKPHRPVDVTSNEQPRSDLKERKKDPADFDSQAVSRDSTEALYMTVTTDVKSPEVPVPPILRHTSLGSAAASRSSSLCQQVQGHAETIWGIQRITPGSGSVNFSITTARDREGPRSSGLLGVLGYPGSKVNIEARAEDGSPSLSQKEKKLQMEDVPGDVKSRGAPGAGGGQGSLQRGSVAAWDRGSSLKRGESSRSVPTNRGSSEGMEVEESQEIVEEATEAEEVQEEEVKTAFGIKLRSRSKKIWPDTETCSPTASTAPFNFTSKSVLAGAQSDKRKGALTGNNPVCIPRKPQTNISPTTSVEVRQTDGTSTSSGSSQLDKLNPLAAGDPTDVPTISSAKEETVQEPQSASQTASPEVSWMSLAMAKTRSLQQLLTGRFPRDSTTAARPQTQGQQTVSRSQKVTQSEMLIGTQTQDVKTQQSATQLQAATETVTPPVTPTETARPSLMPTTLQQRASVAPSTQSHASREPKQSSDPSLKSTTKQPVTQSPLQCPAQPETTPQFAQGSGASSLAQYYLSSAQNAKSQSPSWSNRGVQVKPATSSTIPVPNTASTSTPPPVSALGRGERAAAIQIKEGVSLYERRAVFDGSVGEKAASLEKQAEVAAPPGTKETHTPAESSAPASATPLIRDTKPGVKLAESNPIKVPDKPGSPDDKCLRKNVALSSPPSSSPMQQSPLRSVTNSSQPSWMELAKRKSMAWNDKNMD